jgi:hypothetical protein
MLLVLPTVGNGHMPHLWSGLLKQQQQQQSQ